MKFLIPLLFLTACSTLPVEESSPSVPTEQTQPRSVAPPSGYIQFCNDNPTSLLCPE